MNNLVIFDLDGVLLDARDMHHYAFNDALKYYGGYSVSRDEHVREFDGLPTRKKVAKLVEQGKIAPGFEDNISKMKQETTLAWIDANVKVDKLLVELFSSIQEDGWKIAVCSNSVRSTIVAALSKLGIFLLVDTIISNEQVGRAKPFPDMYWAAMEDRNSVPSKTIILEDSHIGRQAAKESGAHLIPVTQNCVIPVSQLLDKMSQIEGRTDMSDVPWTDKHLHIVIPMAGMGQRFKDAGYTFPKPLIEVHGKPMVQVVVDSLKMPNAHYIFAVQKEHLDKYNLEPFLKVLRPGCSIVPFDGVTDGAATTVQQSLIKSQYFQQWPLIIANSDQYIEWNANETMYQFSQSDVYGGILTFESIHPKYSYAKLENGYVTEVAEKKVISNHATVGVYYWKEAATYDFCYNAMKQKNIRTNGELYVAPVYNQLIEGSVGNHVKASPVKSMWGLGTPEDLQYFLANFKGNV